MFPEAASSIAGRVDALYFFLLGITVFFSVLIAGLIIVYAVKYRRQSPRSIGTKIHGGLALEIALCARLIKGYGETHARGKSSFLRILETLVEGEVINDPEARAKAIRAARESALADPEGRKLEQSLEAQGIAPQPPRPKPMKFMRRPKTDGRKAA